MSLQLVYLQEFQMNVNKKILYLKESVIILLEVMNELISFLQPYVEHECH